ncbi:MEDS domain-containing protein [Streptosporangium subroseum]|uniref:MEDS domain-containing protein n=1 Tax=Streptosporangium subroseum TaxID=106412 RepID=UPI00342C2797
MTPPEDDDQRSPGWIRPGEHLCLTFDDDEEREPVLAAFVSDGLARGDQVIYHTDMTHPAVLIGLLRGWGVDPDPFLARGQLRIDGAEETYFSGGCFDPDLAVESLAKAAAGALRQGYRALRVTGEMSCALRSGPERLAEYESRIKPILETGTAMAVCQYDRRLFAPEQLPRLRGVHDREVSMGLRFDGGLLRIRPMVDPHGLRVEGEVDAATLPVFTTALHEAVRRMSGDIHVDVGKLAFVDLAGLRAIIDLAAGLEAPRSLRLSPESSHVHQLIKMIGWDTTPGLRLSGDDLT